MDSLPLHRPPPTSLVSALVLAGVSLGTAMAMAPWKAEEVLDLLRGGVPGSASAEEGSAPPA
jgi:hypothetical protein